MGVKHARRRERGMAMVELAILLPLLLTILFAVMEFGIAFQRWQVVSNAAREGARIAAVRTASCDTAAVTATVTRYVQAAGIEPADIQLEQNVCVPSGEVVTVGVTYPFRFPVLTNLVPGLEGGLALTGRAVMRKE
jgi:hypothetical protein